MRRIERAGGEDLEGDIGPELTGMDGYAEEDLFEVIYNGIPDGGMPPYSSLGSEKVWQLVNFLREGEE